MAQRAVVFRQLPSARRGWLFFSPAAPFAMFARGDARFSRYAYAGSAARFALFSYGSDAAMPPPRFASLSSERYALRLSRTMHVATPRYDARYAITPPSSPPPMLPL